LPALDLLSEDNTFLDPESLRMKFIDAEKMRLEAKSLYQQERLGEMEELHENAQKALERLQAGKGVMGKNGMGEAQEGEGEGSEGPMGGDGETGGQGGGSLTKNGGITFQELPPTKLPDKGE